MFKLVPIAVLFFLATVSDCQRRQVYRYISPFQTGTLPVGTRQVGTRQVGTRQVGGQQVGTRQIGNGQIGGTQIGTQQGQGQLFQCPSDGPFSDPQDCSKFFQCYAGVPSFMTCPAGLEFNPNNRWCDFPANVPQGICNRVTPVSEANAPCQRQVNNNQAYYVSHPSYCNAFFNCGNGLLYPGCTFCGEGLYFNARVNLCVPTFGADVTPNCFGKSMVRPIDQELTRLEASCRPGRPDVYGALRLKIQQSGYPNNLINNNNNNNNNRIPTNGFNPINTNNLGRTNPAPNRRLANPAPNARVVYPYYPTANNRLVYRNNVAGK